MQKQNWKNYKNLSKAKKTLQEIAETLKANQWKLAVEKVSRAIEPFSFPNQASSPLPSIQKQQSPLTKRQKQKQRIIEHLEQQKMRLLIFKLVRKKQHKY